MLRRCCSCYSQSNYDQLLQQSWATTSSKRKYSWRGCWKGSSEKKQLRWDNSQREFKPSALGGQHKPVLCGWCTHPSQDGPFHGMIPPQDGPHRRMDTPRCSRCRCGLLTHPAPPQLPYLPGPPARLSCCCWAPQARAAGAFPVPTCLGREDGQSHPQP